MLAIVDGNRLAYVFGNGPANGLVTYEFLSN